MLQLTLYGRTYCHLCEDMRVALEPLQREFPFIVHEVDVDADLELESRFGERVPVLVAMGPEGPRELCHYFLDALAVRTWLAAQACAGTATSGRA
ncbi:glutaredoxin family protein [Cupriavidus sp. WKF15]|uniref:glutaredoxin family protein n=1 Tax=Cupriavidus sp. WKF15 TaxID=3032282 RepID=UPI0023E2A2B9|nr:glutaredoxin family protein [Cupriavidus sp. WKF15]WER46951.1 glutaredoxin family protein [Cupriavidus sp. WKF15]